MTSSRKDIKNAVKAVIGTVPGIKAVYTNMPRQQQVFPAVVIAFDKVHEKAATLGNPSRRHITYTVTLYIQSIDANPNEQAAQEEFDDMLDLIDEALRSNKDLDGAALKSAYEYIDTDAFEPQIAGQGQALILRAVKTFTVLVEIMG
ncbi:hypothetical protein [Paenibacillus hexagrammi]|uniref:Phage protein n=1 Tax=Paenibacillus hexagrammi TaxID=2908839 RepID=A0ABY3SRZ7_9BACL|nr:hypothetical protein [Paenibacillus sp. YPD9-1]UJF36632.1 hypothetical protein L0M14_30550 [Paenibacillus sp. YPD9-1]